MLTIQAKAERLLSQLRSYSSVLVAFSAGVDSALVAKAAKLALDDQAVAATGTSHSLAAGELDEAIRLAAEIGIRHEVVSTDEFAQFSYTRNATDRCFHCKTELYSHLVPLARQLDIDVIANGTNLDDLGDYRPGLQAAADFQVRSPLADCDLNKSDVRQLAAFWGLSVQHKPATPCLSSRVAYGEQVTPERLRMIDQAERFLRDLLGLDQLRVRYHRGDLARVELPTNRMADVLQPELHRSIDRRLRELGFRFVTIDLAGFRSGSLNTLVPVETLITKIDPEPSP